MAGGDGRFATRVIGDGKITNCGEIGLLCIAGMCVLKPHG